MPRNYLFNSIINQGSDSKLSSVRKTYEIDRYLFIPLVKVLSEEDNFDILGYWK